MVIAGLTIVLIAALCSASDKPPQANLLLLGSDVEQKINIAVDCYPQALPNDGISEAEISVQVTDGENPVMDQVVRAEVVSGDGLLVMQEVRTDSDGVAKFPYRAGLMPEKSEVAFSLVESELSTSVSIPLAPVAYLDVTLVTPEEYQAYLGRQASAAPIYTMQTEVFPDQLAADGGSISAIWINLNHVDGSAAAGVPLTTQVISGEGSLDTEQVITDAEGHAEVQFIAGFTPGTATVQIIEPSTGLASAVDILLIESGPARVQLYYGDPMTINTPREGAIMPADGISELPLIAEVTDLMGVPLAGIELDISVLDTANGWVDMIDPVSDIEGRVEFVYRVGTTTGPVRLRAFIANGLYDEGIDPFLGTPVPELGDSFLE